MAFLGFVGGFVAACLCWSLYEHNPYPFAASGAFAIAALLVWAEVEKRS